MLNDRIFSMLADFAGQVYEEVKPDVVICLGDVFHTRKPSADAIEFATKWFSFWSSAAQHVLIIPGNHDTDAFSKMTAVDFLDDLGTNIQIFYEPTEYLDMLFVPYQRVISPQLRERIRVHRQVFLHQGYSEAVIYGNTRYGLRADSVTPQDLEGKDLALIGHVHTPHYEPDSNIYVIGAPYQLRYADRMLERGFGCWTLEDPSDFQLLRYNQNFYLETIQATVQANTITEKELTQRLPAPAKDHYYKVELSVEGRIKAGLMEDLRRVVQTIYQDKLDGLSLVPVLPQSERSFYHALKTASSLKASHAPGEMLSIYMDGAKGNYYKANPELKERVLDEFNEVIQAVSENGKG